MAGEIFMLGVGPGDPELITVKAVNILRRADIIYVPESDKGGRSVAEAIIRPYVDMAKTCPSYFPMTDDREELEARYTALAQEIKGHVDDGKTVAYVTLGDNMLYSTSLYVAEKLSALDITPTFIAGVTSYVAAANIAQIPLGERRERIAIQPMPDNIDELHEVAAKFDTVVLMKVAKRLPILLRYIDEYKPAVATLVKRASMPDEEIFDLTSAQEVAPEAGYLAVAILKLRS
jgi:precorrin-2/cobalt-factor-2 C20-methyltransferase